MARHPAGSEPGNKLNKQKESKKRKPDRLKSDGTKDDRSWPTGSGHHRAGSNR